MANVFYTAAREGLLTREINWLGSEQRIALTRGYTPNASHVFLSNFTSAGGTIVVSKVLVVGAADDGYGRSDTVTFTAVPSGAQITGLLIYQSEDADGTPVADSAKRLICAFDQTYVLPVTPDGSDITVEWPLDRIFRI